MKKLNGREMKALLILSVVVPVGLLASFRLTGILKEPSTEFKRTTLEPVTLNLTRPSETVAIINSSIQNKWTTEGASILVGVEILDYYEGAGASPFDGHDGVVFRAYTNASFEQGSLNVVKMSFHPTDSNAALYVSQNPHSLHLNNATLRSMHYWGTNVTDAYMEINVLDPACSISDQIFWVFLDQNGSHEVQVTAEATMAGKTSSEIITIPVELRVTAAGTAGFYSFGVNS